MDVESIGNGDGTEMEKIIQVKHLEKSFPNQKAVQGVDFYIKTGQTFALLGPNGAGKSTIINLLSTCDSLDKGEILIDGLTLGQHNTEIRKRIGVVFQNGVLDDLLTVEENLYLRGTLYGLHRKSLHNRIYYTAGLTGITPLLHRPYGILSGGQRRRCDIARALLPYPKILFLDEPTTGLDPEIRAELWRTLSQIKEETNMTLLMTTHYMEEAAHADYISILNNGKIIAAGTPSILKEKFSANQLILSTNQIQNLQSILHNNNIPYQTQPNQLNIPLTRTLDALSILDMCRGKISSFEVLRGTMDDAYLSIIEGRTGHA